VLSLFFLYIYVGSLASIPRSSAISLVAQHRHISISVLLSHAVVLLSLTGCRRIYAARYLNFTTDESESIRGDRMANLSASGDIDAAEEELALAQRRCAELKAATEKPSEKVRLNLADTKAVKEARVKKPPRKRPKRTRSLNLII
jgi:hypothetical protein